MSNRQPVALPGALLGVSLGFGILVVLRRARTRHNASRKSALVSSGTASSVDPNQRRRYSSSHSATSSAMSKAIDGFRVADIVAGHSISSRRKPKSVGDPVALVHERLFFKPLQSGERGDRERIFYEKYNGKTKAISRYAGCVAVKGVEYLRLDDIEADFAYPCTVDIKLGRELRHPGADEAKKKRGREKWKYMAETATAVCGMKVYRPYESCGVREGASDAKHKYGSYARWQKEYGRSLKGDGILHAILAFLHNGHEVRTDVIGGLESHLLVIRQWLAEETQYECYSLSVLLCYDGDVKSVSEEANPLRATRAVLVDFAHSFELTESREKSSQIQDCIAGVDHILQSLRLVREMFAQLKPPPARRQTVLNS